MRKMFLFLTVIAVLTAPAMVTEGAEITSDNAVVVEVTEEQEETEVGKEHAATKKSEATARREEKQEAKLEKKLLKEAKNVAREIYKAQRAAEKSERVKAADEIVRLKLDLITADKETKKEIRAKISELKENREFESVNNFLETLTFSYGDGNEVSSRGYVVSVTKLVKELGAKVEYDNNEKVFTITRDNITITVELTEDGAYINGETVKLTGDKKENTEEEPEVLEDEVLEDII